MAALGRVAPSTTTAQTRSTTSRGRMFLTRREVTLRLSLEVRRVLHAVASSGRREWAALRDDHEYQGTCGSVRSRRTCRCVNGSRRLEERAARRQDLFRLMVDGKAHLSFQDVSEDWSRMTVTRA